MNPIEDNLSEDDIVALSPREQDDVVEIQSSVEKIRFCNRVILVAVAPGCAITVATFGIAKDLDVETEIRKRTDEMENENAKFVCLICEPYLKTYAIVNKTYKAIAGKRKVQNTQLEFPDGTSLDMLLFIFDLQLRGLVFKKVAIEMPKGSGTPLTERVTFRSYSKPAFYMDVDMTIASQKKPKKPKKPIKKEKLDLSNITGKPVKKRFTPKKKD